MIFRGPDIKPDVRSAICEAYRQRRKVHEIAHDYGVSPQSVSRIANKAGLRRVKLRPRTRQITRDEAEEFARRVKEGEWCQDVCRSMNRWRENLVLACDRFGIEYRPKPKQKYTADYKRAAVDRFNESVRQGMTFRQSAGSAGHSATVLSQWASNLHMSLLTAAELREPWEIMEIFCNGPDAVNSPPSQIYARSLHRGGKVQRRIG